MKTNPVVHFEMPYKERYGLQGSTAKNINGGFYKSSRMAKYPSVVIAVESIT